MKETKWKETVINRSVDQDMEATFEMESAEWNEQGMDTGGPSSFEGGAEKLIDAGFFNAFDDDFDEDDIAM